MIRWAWLLILFSWTSFSLQAAESCSDCHQAQAKSWNHSHHHRAMALATPDQVRGNFDNVVAEEQGYQGRFFTKDGHYFCETEGKDGKTRVFQISHVFGWTPLQQYLVQMDQGEVAENGLPKTQVLPWTWDTEKKEWYHIYKHDMTVPGEPLHWTGWGQNWNHMCADCHVTEYKKNFDPQSMTYNSTFVVDNVSCMACHELDDCHKDKTEPKYPTLTGLAAINPIKQQVEINRCTPCHSHREQFQSGFKPNHALEDHYGINLLSEDLYHHDGQIKEEVYVLGSFLQSKMYQVGVRCSNCHDPHSLKLKLPQAQVCSQCHEPKVYDAPSHHFHKQGSAGANCLECHMPESTYMGVDPRRDHSMRVPRPDLSTKLGSPNACVGCHLHESKQTQSRGYQDQIKRAKAGDLSLLKTLESMNADMTEAFHRWYGKDHPTHYGEVFHGARNGDAASLKELEAIAQDPAFYGPITRATAMQIMSQHGIQPSSSLFKIISSDQNPMLRRSLTQFSLTKQQLQPLLEDPILSVRFNALRAYLYMMGGAQSTDAKDRAVVQARMSDLKAYVEVNGDQSGAHHLMAQAQMVLNDLKASKASFELALKVQPELTGVRIPLANLLENDGEQKRAEELRREEVGLMKRDLKLAPSRSDLWYRLGLIEYGLGREQETIEAMRAVLELVPNHYNAGAFVIQLNQRRGRWSEVKSVAQGLLKHYPRDQWLEQVMRESFQKK